MRALYLAAALGGSSFPDRDNRSGLDADAHSTALDILTESPLFAVQVVNHPVVYTRDTTGQSRWSDGAPDDVGVKGVDDR